MTSKIGRENTVAFTVTQKTADAGNLKTHVYGDS